MLPVLLSAALQAATPAPSDLLASGAARLDAGEDPAAVLDTIGDLLLDPAGLDAPGQMKLWGLVGRAEQKLGAAESQHLLLAYDASQRCLAVVTFEGDQPLRDACTALAAELAPAKAVYDTLTTPLPPTLLFLAYRADAAKSLDRAHAYAAAVTVQAPAVADGWYLAGITRYNQAVSQQGKLPADKIGGMLREAEGDFAKAWALDATNTAARDGLARLCKVLKDTSQGCKDAQAASAAAGGGG